MPNKERDVEVDAGDDHPPKQRRSKSERKPDKERSHRTHRSSKSTRSRTSEGSETHSHSSTRRHRKKEKDADRSEDKDRDHDRDRDRDRNRDRDRDRDRDKDKDGLRARVSSADLFSGVSSTPRISLPYPSFSKAHSKEAIQSRDSLSPSKRPDPYTPETTDVGADADRDGDARKTSTEERPAPGSDTPKKSSRPPTPPDTDLSAGKKGPEEALKEEELDRPKSRTSGISRSGSNKDDKSKLSQKSRSSSQATFVQAALDKVHEKLRPDSRPSSRTSVKRSSSTRSLKKPSSSEMESSLSSVQDSSPRTPTRPDQFPHIYGGDKPEPPETPDLEDDGPDIHSKTATPASAMAVPPPPPPPPPPALDFQEIPRVDYLLQNGGLAYPVPKTFLAALPRQNGTRPSNPPLAGADTLFAPFFNLLDQYSSVLTKQGSIAVATGHKSIARRLLDRLEDVFCRDLPSHGCSCVMCDQSHEIHRGLTWGDVLEWVSGRIELPAWPPFDLADVGTKAAEISAEEPQRPSSPIKMDPDIAEEFREHYLRQSMKVRSAVDKWLNKTGETPVPPPQEVDDETLAFAILTNLDPEDRPYFNALMSGSRELRPATRAPTPSHRQRSDFVIKCGLSLQRLYRLQQVPRDAESIVYLIKNPHTHDLLITLSNINNSEWEILTSGRFDGFLWSGADDESGPSGLESRGVTPGGRSSIGPFSRGPSAMGSRTTTPFSPYSRGTTPASFVSLASSGQTPGGGGGNRQAVSSDEEMEMAIIAEIEREIYTGMESLEDAFEKLHHQAELVRTSLRQRGAGLMQKLQNRKRIDVLAGPPSGNSQSSGHERPEWAAGSDGEGGGSDSEWGFDDVDIMPDDSASNISSARHRRPKRRTERRTPAPIEEGDEE